MSPAYPRWLRIAEEVREALGERRAVVALESTLLTHGLPKDRAAQVAQLIEGEVRAAGAVPATIAGLDHCFAIGLSAADRSRLLEGPTRKASVRDLAVAVAKGGLWSTTVAATMVLAHRAGIRAFATGGLGGVHRHAEQSFDESADLTALSRTPVVVVSAGIKTVLDIPRTVERLETLGVPVVGYQCDEMPAFYHPHSGVRLAARVDTPGDVAQIMTVQLDDLGAGLLVVQPPPRAWDAVELETLIETALGFAEREGIRGSEVTPYLLSRLRAASTGKLVDLNIALVRANAALAARITVADRAAKSVEYTAT